MRTTSTCIAVIAMLAAGCLQYDPTIPPGIHLSATADRDTIRTGELATITARFANGGPDRPVVAVGCGMPFAFHLIDGNGTEIVPYPQPIQCAGYSTPRFAIGRSYEATFAWDGLAAAEDGSGRPAPPGPYTVMIAAGTEDPRRTYRVNVTLELAPGD